MIISSDVNLSKGVITKSAVYVNNNNRAMVIKRGFV